MLKHVSVDTIKYLAADYFSKKSVLTKFAHFFRTLNFVDLQYLLCSCDMVEYYDQYIGWVVCTQIKSTRDFGLVWKACIYRYPLPLSSFATKIIFTLFKKK